MPNDDLLAYLTDQRPHPLTPSLAEWLAGSRRFAAFAEANRDKIRKKLRGAQEPQPALDLRVELETAALLLGERQLSLVYEPQGLGRTRGPDFAVDYTTSTRCMVEVTRLRAPQSGAEPQPEAERLAEAVCGKLGQLLPQVANVLIVGVETGPLTPEDLALAIAALRRRAEQGDQRLLQRSAFRDTADFFKHFQRLSEVLVRGQTPAAWVNPQARHPLPSRVRTALRRSQGL
ncbi:MAG TPA: hypothetical protein VFS21_30560 [Roseiflexaceae bacterium]|nr:hypothetical protein [Roseiflexaceae bacterium]